MSLALTQPHLPSCDQCEAVVYDLTTGRAVRKFGRPVKRQPGHSPPCHTCPKIAAGDPPTPAMGRRAELTPANERAYAHYREGRATGWAGATVDSRVRRTADIVRQIEDAVAANREGGLAAVLAQVVAASAIGKGGAKR